MKKWGFLKVAKVTQTLIISQMEQTMLMMEHLMKQEKYYSEY